MSFSKYKKSAPNYYYHLYNRGNHKQDIFRDEYDYHLYLSRLRSALKRFDFSLVCYCLMPNHVHLVVRQLGDFAPARLISSVHTSYAMMFNKKYESVGHLFQGRFKQKIVDTDEYMKCLTSYIHLNPVKARICTTPESYLWSSYREYAMTEVSPRGLCDISLINGYGLKGLSFKKYVAQASRVDPVDAFDEFDEEGW